MALTQEYGFSERLGKAGLSLRSGPIEILQVNITKLCNQACVHCHVDASPRRREMASPEVIAEILRILKETSTLHTLDITGGAPELHPQFRDLVRAARALQKRVIVRHNLTVTMDPHPISQESMADLPDFFAEQGVELVSSLPYYQEYFTDKQRGQGVFEKSLASIRLLNERGYGTDESSLRLNLVYNPVGAFLPASQQSLEQDFKRELWQKFQLRFNLLFTITNMPIHRFKAQLVKLGGYESYMEKLMAAFNPATVSGLMCRSMVSVSEKGELYDCDFNQMLRLSTRGVKSLFDFDAARLQEREIVVGDHCYGCTAGAGSSCGGAVS